MTIASYLNSLATDACRDALTRCCGSKRWVEAMLAERPFATEDTVFASARRIWRQLGREDFLEAFLHHPKIGSDIESLRQKFPATHGWSSQEQASVGQAAEATLQALAQGNRDYEAKFGYIFIVCATGKSAPEMLAILQDRLPNAPEDEILIAAGEQEKITTIRLEKLRPKEGTMSSPITTHVLDTNLGKPAPGLPIQLFKRDDLGGFAQIARGVTNQDGRIRDLLPPGSLQAGVYRMRFDTGHYFAALQTRTFYPEALITFEIVATSEHYHIPLLLSPFGYSTYRGS